MSDINDIKNQEQLDFIFQNNTSQQISPTDLRQFVASVAPYGGVMRTTAVDPYSVTATPTNLIFLERNITGNALMNFDLANDEIEILAAGIYLITWRLNGEWAATDDIVLRINVNDIPDPDAYSITKGLATSNPVSVSVSSYPIPITSVQIAAGGGSATLSLKIDGDGSAFNIEIYNAQMECNYLSLTKDLF